MGTRRSKHNRGVKPLYKEINRDTARRIEFEKPPKEKIVPFGHRHQLVRTPAPEPALDEAVARFLASRNVSAPVPEKPQRSVENLERITCAAAPLNFSTRDLLLQLFAERKIDRVQFGAGRSWQHFMEAATVQPSISIDPGAPLSKQHWQNDGDLTEIQYKATKIRRMATGALGSRAFQFLETILQPDIGRAEAMALTRMSGDAMANVLGWLLQGLAIFFCKRNGYEGDAYGAFREAAAMRTDYEMSTVRQ